MWQNCYITLRIFVCIEVKISSFKDNNIKMSTASYIETSAPGRICLFGEHQDYLGLPVIAMAINLRITVSGKLRSDSDTWHVNLKDIKKSFEFDPNQECSYRSNSDYLFAAANVLRRDYNVTWPCAYTVDVHGNIPINSGSSSSSALQVAWCAFLLAAANDARADNPGFVAKVANLSEVCEFGAPGGVMDHQTCSHGGLVLIDTNPPIRVKHLKRITAPFLLIESGVRKDTTGVLKDRRRLAETGRTLLKWLHPESEKNVWDCVTESELATIEKKAGSEVVKVLRGNIANRIIRKQATELLLDDPMEHLPEIGELLRKHQRHLSTEINVSHPLIDEVLAEADRLGSLGGKINGSGCGGSFYVLLGNDPKPIEDMLAARGLKSWLVTVGDGLRVLIEK